MSMKFTCTFAALLLLSGTAFCADRALGFGWNSSKQTEIVYSVDVATGEISQTGTIPDLKALAAGSFCRDPVTQAVAVLGYTVDKFNEYSSGRIFVLDPTRNTTASFLLPKLKVNFIFLLFIVIFPPTYQPLILLHLYATILLYVHQMVLLHY